MRAIYSGMFAILDLVNLKLKLGRKFIKIPMNGTTMSGKFQKIL